MSPIRLAVIFTLSIVLILSTCYSQTFDPNVADMQYLDLIQERLQRDVMEAHTVLINQTKILQQVTRNFIDTKVKENLFKAVRARIEQELEMMEKNNETLRQARQEDTEDDDEANTSSPRPPGLLPQLASVVTTLFGPDVNVTGYLKDATSFLPPDISYRIITAASLIDPQRFTSTSTLPPVIINGQVIPQEALINNSAYINYEYGIAPPSAVQQPGIVIQGLAQAPTIQQPGIVIQGLAQSPNVQQGGVIQGIDQQITLRRPGSNGVTQGVVVQSPLRQPQGPSQPVSSQQGITPQFKDKDAVGTSANGESNLKTNPVFVRAQTIVPAQQTIIIQPELSGVPQTASNVEGVYNFNNISPAIQVANNIPEPRTTPATSEEDEDSSEDDNFEFPIARDDTDPPLTETIAQYPALNYAVKLINRLRIRASQIPTTTEYTNVTVKSIDSIEEEEAKATSPATTTFQTLVKGGIYVYEGAREAYQLLQQLNKFLDRVSERLDNSGFGPETIGLNVDDQ